MTSSEPFLTSANSSLMFVNYVMISLEPNYNQIFLFNHNMERNHLSVDALPAVHLCKLCTCKICECSAMRVLTVRWTDLMAGTDSGNLTADEGGIKTNLSVSIAASFLYTHDKCTLFIQWWLMYFDPYLSAEALQWLLSWCKVFPGHGGVFFLSICVCIKWFSSCKN